MGGVHARAARRAGAELVAVATRSGAAEVAGTVVLGALAVLAARRRR